MLDSLLLNISLNKQTCIQVTYPTRTEKGHPSRTPAATPRMAKGGESWNHPVMATSVVYMQKEDGKNAKRGKKSRTGKNKGFVRKTIQHEHVHTYPEDLLDERGF